MSSDNTDEKVSFWGTREDWKPLVKPFLWILAFCTILMLGSVMRDGITMSPDMIIKFILLDVLFSVVLFIGLGMMSAL